MASLKEKKKLIYTTHLHNDMAIKLIKFNHYKTQRPFHPLGHDWRCSSGTIRKKGFIGKGHDCTSLTSRTGICAVKVETSVNKCYLTIIF